MKAKLMAVLCIGVALGCAVMWAVGRSTEARAATESKVEPQYEYKAVVFGSGDAEKMTKNLNELGADGWEYAGPILNSGSGVDSSGYVCFRRPKK